MSKDKTKPSYANLTRPRLDIKPNLPATELEEDSGSESENKEAKRITTNTKVDKQVAAIHSELKGTFKTSMDIDENLLVKMNIRLMQLGLNRKEYLHQLIEDDCSEISDDLVKQFSLRPTRKRIR